MQIWMQMNIILKPQSIKSSSIVWNAIKIILSNWISLSREKNFDGVIWDLVLQMRLVGFIIIIWTKKKNFKPNQSSGPTHK